MEKVVFLDTMIYLHFRAVEEVDWRVIVSASRVRIVIPRITVRELDKHKDSHSARKIRERARRVLKKIEEWAQAEFTEIRTGVQVQIFLASPSFPLEAHDLDPQRNDDVLIASALEFRNRSPDARVALVTQDTTPRITARGLGIEVFRLPEELKLPAEADPLELENQELRKRISKIEAALPKLTLGFSGDSKPLDRIFHQVGDHIGASEAEIQELWQAETEKYPARSRDSVLGRLSQSDIERYDRDRAKYFDAYQKYLIGEQARKRQQQRIVRLNVEVHNVGTAPAEDIDVELRFDQALPVFRGNVFEAKPLTPPTPPKAPRTTHQVAMELMTVSKPWESIGLSAIIPPLPRHIDPPNVSTLTINDNVARFHIRRLKHDYLVKADEIVVFFNDAATMTSFHVDYSIHTGSLPDSVTGQLHVIMK